MFVYIMAPDPPKPVSPEAKRIKDYLQSLHRIRVDNENLDPDKTFDLIVALDAAIGTLDLKNCNITLLGIIRILGLGDVSKLKKD